MQNSPRTPKQPYTSPTIETVSVEALLEAVGPAQTLASGVEAAVAMKKLHRNSGKHRGHGNGHR